MPPTSRLKAPLEQLCREAHRGGRLANGGQRDGQVPRLGEEREAGDLLLCGLIGLHARGSHLRPPRVQNGRAPIWSVKWTSGTGASCEPDEARALW